MYDNKFHEEVNKEGGIIKMSNVPHLGTAWPGRLLKKPITNLRMKNFISVLLLPFHREGESTTSKPRLILFTKYFHFKEGTM